MTVVKLMLNAFSSRKEHNDGSIWRLVDRQQETPACTLSPTSEKNLNSALNLFSSSMGIKDSTEQKPQRRLSKDQFSGTVKMKTQISRQHK